ncbi:MAG: hypothetical protein EOO41_01505 [Methanobacteriota archaeon]|nr:MAG: hypothetical protein EOO41_01505 [Euryarchaeota archaeon]
MALVPMPVRVLANSHLPPPACMTPLCSAASLFRLAEGGDRPPRSFDREGGGRGGFSGRGGYGGDRDSGRREGGRGGYGGDRDGGRREGGGHSGRRDGSYGGGDHRGHVGY